MDDYLINHIGHDYAALMKRWRSVVERSGLIMDGLYGVGDEEVFVIRNQAAVDGAENGNYFSAGVHGDECAPVSALLEWAETHPESLQQQAFTIFPCMNPVGLLENHRVDGDGIDLNRNFQNLEIPLIKAWQEFLKDSRFSIAVNLHEDYDAHGIYIYELSEKTKPADRLLSACQDVIPREMKSEVDGNPFVNGIMTHDGDLHEIVKEDLAGGYPEAIYLALHHTDCALTFETPSEFSLTDRVTAHRRFLEEVVAMQEA